MSPPPLDTVHAVAAEHGMVVAQEKIAARDRRRHPAARRQRGRCRGRGRLCAGRDLSARRQYRRRRLHGDPSRRRATRTSRSTIARPRRPRPRATCSSTPTASPIRRSRAIPALGIGVPGTVAGPGAGAARNTARASSRSPQLIAPAIALARDGFAVDDDIADSLPRVAARGWRAGRRRRRSFSSADGTPLARGDRLVQTDLAATLRAIAEQGPRGFYEGPVAEKLAAAVQRRRRHHDARTI